MVVEIILHENYTSGIYNVTAVQNDIALLKVSEPFDLATSKKVQAALLPKTDVQAGESLITVGWGRTSTNKPSDVLMEVKLPIIDTKTCRSMTASDISYGTIADSVICAGGQGGIGACQGDSGGPSYQLGPNGTQIVVGVTSWGFECGIAGNSDVSSRVFSYLPWIREKTGIK